MNFMMAFSFSLLLLIIFSHFSLVSPPPSHWSPSLSSSLQVTYTLFPLSSYQALSEHVTQLFLVLFLFLQMSLISFS